MRPHAFLASLGSLLLILGSTRSAQAGAQGFLEEAGRLDHHGAACLITRLICSCTLLVVE